MDRVYTLESEYATKHNQPSQGLRAYSHTATTGLVFLWSNEMDRDTMIDEYLEVEESILHDLDNDELFGAERMEEIRQRQIEELLESYDEELNQQDDNELFGEAGVEEMRANEIDMQLDAERERLEALSDEELADVLDDEEALLKELQNLGE